ncbi:site-specific integrase [Christensenella hongkongensis]|uniref:Prophage LambdaBa04, site-specific recombinase, phage integrase family n=1 Tax=Christensenella hongkongensis TaxID=270498 RepID=A0A0M2NN08_9FIRM|nr:site-specific integrase [Christensenella hongkongensis]KKI51585.1 Prophage LambdaBa04, site-specific recombinase, phage integrase family [Christensenella hongkongensis]TCW25508.1 integrase [Christensenella hongkongensis]
MAVSARKVKNRKNADGILTGKPGTVYDVYIKYVSNGERKTYGKRGFATKTQAEKHEAEMKVKLSKPSYTPLLTSNGKQTVKEYMEDWVEKHGKANLRPSTLYGYRGYIKNHIVPYIGNVPLNQVTGAMLDDLFSKLYAKGLSHSSVRYTQRILSVAMEHARKYRYIEFNPARDIITKFGKQGKTPDPYTIEQMQHLMANTYGTEWEMSVMLGGMYGLRRSEILGLRWCNVDLENKTFSVIEQLPFKVPPKTKIIKDFAPPKSHGRILPITEATMPYFLRQFENQQKQKKLLQSAGKEYYDNDLVVSRPDGAPMRAGRISENFAHMLEKYDMPHIRFHDLRHTAATNMYQLTGDFYSVGEILGHTLKGIGMSLGISSNMEAVTAQYVDVRLERKQVVLDTYHDALHSEKNEQKEEKPNTKASKNMEL